MQTIYHWTDPTKPHNLCMSVQKSGFWSVPFPIEEIGKRSFTINFGREEVPFSVETRDSYTANFIVFSRHEASQPPFEIENNTPLRLLYNQRSCDVLRTLEPGEKAPYYWDLPIVEAADKKKKLVLKFLRSSERATQEAGAVQTIELNPVKIKVRKPLHMSNDLFVWVFVAVSGSTLKVCCTSDRQRVRAELGEGATQDSSMLAESAIDTVDLPETELRLRLKGLGISIIDDTPAELLFLSLEDIRATYVITERDVRACLRLGWLQIDNQQLNTIFPVLLRPSKVILG